MLSPCSPHYGKPYSPPKRGGHCRVNNLEHLGQLYFSKPHMHLFKEHASAVCKIVSKYLEYLDNQVTRATEAQNVTKKELSKNQSCTSSRFFF